MNSTRLRKQKLSDRSYVYAAANSHTLDTGVAAAQGFRDGYKAAMRDMRKLIKECYADAIATHPDNPGKRIAHRNHCARVRTEQFLKPLR